MEPSGDAISPPQVGKRSRLERNFAKEVLLGGGLLITMFGLGGEAIKDWWQGNEAEICRLAHETMLAERLNGEVAEPARRRYLELQARHAISCASRGRD